MSKLFTGSICYTDLVAAAKGAHSSFSRADNGKIYANIAIWVNEEPDKYGNEISLQLNSNKDVEEDKVYFGRAKAAKKKEIRPISLEEAKSASSDDDDLPF